MTAVLASFSLGVISWFGIIIDNFVVNALLFINAIPCKEAWAAKNWCFQTVVLEKTLESPLGCKEVKPVHPKGNQPWIFIGRTDAEVEALILWPPDVKSWITGKDPDAGKDWRQEEKGMTEDEMAGWHHWLNWPEFELCEIVEDRDIGLLQVMGLQRLNSNINILQETLTTVGICQVG